VATTDLEARQRFRRDWAVFSPGILLIRGAGLKLLRADAEQQARAAGLAHIPDQGNRTSLGVVEVGR
jgi:hypothetical protein